MIPAEFRIDLFDQIQTLVGGFEPIVLSRVIQELEGLSRIKGRQGSAARLGLTLGKNCSVADVDDLMTGTVDEQVIEYAVRHDCLVVTNDKRLREILFARGIGVISMRKQKKMELLRR